MAKVKDTKTYEDYSDNVIVKIEEYLKGRAIDGSEASFGNPEVKMDIENENIIRFKVEGGMGNKITITAVLTHNADNLEIEYEAKLFGYGPFVKKWCKKSIEQLHQLIEIPISNKVIKSPMQKEEAEVETGENSELVAEEEAEENAEVEVEEEAGENAEVEAGEDAEVVAEEETEDILESRPEESISSIIGNEYPDLPNQLSEIEITDLNTLNAKFYKDEYFLVSLFKYQAVDNEKIKILVRKRLEEIEEWDKQEPERIRGERPILDNFMYGSFCLGIIGIIWSFFSENNNILHYFVYLLFLSINWMIYDSTFGYTKGWGRIRKLFFYYSIIMVLIISVYIGNFGDFAREFLLIILEDGFNLDIQYDYYYWDGL